ncbi:Glutamine synthetase [Megamonas hypermegale]|uniref:glutamine synthetase n=1 Tax=Megamonas hypermegale TaxID=158847 RepID=A0A239TL42_9FIRM|nr:glutamine synthetase [Megamonas hypermegale]MBM6760513.1 glutamine synthetase [Megamonas hypermegale]SNU98159.1 Glutamine synthetase [Megamonas hypermegale]
MNDLLYVIPANSTKEDIIATLKQHPEIKFVSLVGIDLAGNDTDEKIPMRIFLEDIDAFYNGSAVQTDGSSVVLTGIATLNNAKVDMPIDPTVNWFVDYNMESYDEELEKPIGTLRIPAALIHEGKAVDSRSVLAETLNYVKKGLLNLFKEYPTISGLEHINGADVKDIVFTSATELEFWVKTPLSDADIPEMSASQVMQEQYWQRTRGSVRTALEQCVLALEAYGLSPEMGHKEVGGMKGHMDSDGNMSHVCEQIEIDWKFADALQAADNELAVRILVKEIFRENGLEVIFKAKPMIGLAGNGEHTHIGMGAIMKDGSFVNLFAPTDMKKDFMSAIGYGAIMGLLKNYEVINPFVSATNDSLNRLKPGFEAPVCIVTSLGHNPAVPSRNRTILAGLVRDVNNPKATRFELRACNPYTNTYLVLAAIYSAVLDGVKYAASKTTTELLEEISKQPGETAGYLETDRAYRAEDDVFEDYTEEERNQRFGVHPATVWENLSNLSNYPEKRKVLTASGALRDQIIDAFVNGELIRWKTELISRIIPENRALISKFKEIKSAYVTDEDSYNWNKINRYRYYLAKDSIDQKSLFTQLIKALNSDDFATASSLQVEMYDKMEELKALYASYKDNMI